MFMSKKNICLGLRRSLSGLLCAAMVAGTVGYSDWNTNILAATEEETVVSEENTIVSEVPAIYLTSGVEETAIPISTLKKENGYTACSVEMADKDGNSLITEPLSASIKVRGNTTSKADKKPYTIKFATKQNLLGMGKAKKYCLIANAYDPTLMRNYIALKLAKELGLEYTSECEFVDLYLDGEYWGNYLLVEPVEEGSNRVDIDVTKGEFMIEYEKERVDVADSGRLDVTIWNQKLGDLWQFDPDDPAIKKSSGGTVYIELGNNNFRFILSEPEYDTDEEELQAARNAKAVLQNIKDTITKEEGVTMEELARVIDVKSFAKVYLLNEYLKVVDAGFSSGYFYYKNGKLYAGPVWDYDLSSGNAGAHYTGDYTSYNNCKRNQYNPESLKSAEGFWAQANFFGPLMNTHSFSYAVMNLYQNEKTKALFESVYKEGGWIDQILDNYKGTIDLNYTKWAVRDDKNCGKNQNGDYANVGMRYADETYKENVEFLRKWLAARDKWLSGPSDDISDATGWNLRAITKDYTTLFELIYQAVELDSSKYTNFEEVEKALKQAAAADVSGATSEELEAATKALETAIANLKEKETFCLADFQLSNFGDRVAGEKIANREEDNAYVTSALGVESLFAGHVAGERNRSLKWSKDLYTDNNVEMAVPVMDPKDSGEWGTEGEVYFQLETSTRGYDSLVFSATLGATKKGARDYKLQYSLDGQNFQDITGTEVSLSDNKKMQPLYQEVSLPGKMDNARKVYLRIVVNSDITVDGTQGFFGGTSGEIAIDHIKLVATEKSEVDCTEYDKVCDQARGLESKYYESKGFEELQKILEVVSEIDASANDVTQEIIDETVEKLKVAMEQLVEKPNYLVQYETNGGEAIPDAEYIVGDEFAYAVPVFGDYEFECWCVDEDLTVQYDTSKMPASDLTLYARWKGLATATLVPDPTEVPVVTSAPAVTATPVVTVTPTPKVTSTPKVTPTPRVTPTPVVTATPKVTVTPRVTSTPKVTATPVVTATPIVTAIPTVQPTIAVTMSPIVDGEVTEEPKATADVPIPSPTEEVPQQIPSSNAGGESSKDAAVFTLAAEYKIPMPNKLAVKVVKENPTEITLYTDGLTRAQLSVDIFYNPGDSEVVWASTKRNVATISEEGTIVAKNPGVTYVTVRIGDTSVCCVVTVKKASLKVANEKKMAVLKRGKRVKINVNANPKGKVLFKSSNKKVVRVDARGKLVARKPGTAKIYVTCNGMKKMIIIKVKK